MILDWNLSLVEVEYAGRDLGEASADFKLCYRLLLRGFNAYKSKQRPHIQLSWQAKEHEWK